MSMHRNSISTSSRNKSQCHTRHPLIDSMYCVTVNVYVFDIVDLDFMLRFLHVVVPGSELAMRVSTDTSFKSLEGAVCESTLKAVTDMNFTHMTEIQAKTIPPLLEGR